MSKSCIHEGDLIVAAGQTVTTDATDVTGSIRVGDRGTLNAPLLAQARDVWVRGGATLNAPVLAQARDVTVGSSFTGAYYRPYVGATLNAPVLAPARDVTVGDRGTLIATAAVLAKIRSA